MSNPMNEELLNFIRMNMAAGSVPPPPMGGGASGVDFIRDLLKAQPIPESSPLRPGGGIPDVDFDGVSLPQGYRVTPGGGILEGRLGAMQGPAAAPQGRLSQLLEKLGGAGPALKKGAGVATGLAAAGIGGSVLYNMFTGGDKDKMKNIDSDLNQAINSTLSNPTNPITNPELGDGMGDILDYDIAGALKQGIDPAVILRQMMSQSHWGELTPDVRSKDSQYQNELARAYKELEAQQGKAGQQAGNRMDLYDKAFIPGKQQDKKGK